MDIINPHISFTIHYFEKINLDTHIIRWNEDQYRSLDAGLRKTILRAKENVYFKPYRMIPDLVSHNVICCAHDRYLCRYIFIPIPASDTQEVLFAGPYLNSPTGIDDIRKLIEVQQIPSGLLGILSQYYSTLPVLENENMLEGYLMTLGASLFGENHFEMRYYIEKDKHPVSYHTEARAKEGEDTAARLARRYRVEEEMMDAIAHGDTQKAVQLQRDPVFSNLDERVNIPLRNIKNYLIILNTLGRKAAQRGGVHPVYLDELSRKIAIQIENASSMKLAHEIEREIVRRYSMLVQSYTTQGYSQIVRDIVSYIHVHYADTDLTLQNTADHFSLNKSYLATLFKKETGVTLTQYVNARRIDHAILLLNTQEGSIQNIASACGIPDTTYFTRIFRREKGMSPTEYRKMLTRTNQL